MNPSKRTTDEAGVAGLGVRIISVGIEGGAIEVEAILILRLVLATAVADGILSVIFNSFVVIFVQFVPLVLHCIPGATPVKISRAKSISSPLGASAGPLGTSTILTKENGAVAVAAILICTVIASLPNTFLVIVVPTTLVHVVPLSRLNSLVAVNPVMASEAGLYVALGAFGLLGTLILRISDANRSFVFLTLI